jgi:hypothetical protein
MPECHRCERVQATAELRRTSLGYLCKDNGPGTHCYVLARERRMRERRARPADGSGQLRLEAIT